MKIIKTTGIGIILIMLFALCTEYPKGYDPDRFAGEVKYLSVIAEVSETEIPIKITDNYQIKFYGNVASCNLSQSGAPCITVSGAITETDAAGNFNFRDGEMLLESTITNCKLWGQFSGKGSLEGNRFTINSDVELACGTGLFESNGGTLKMTISGVLPSEDNPSPIYELTLNGQLEI